MPDITIRFDCLTGTHSSTNDSRSQKSYCHALTPVFCHAARCLKGGFQKPCPLNLTHTWASVPATPPVPTAPHARRFSGAITTVLPFVHIFTCTCVPDAAQRLFVPCQMHASIFFMQPNKALQACVVCGSEVEAEWVLLPSCL